MIKIIHVETFASVFTIDKETLNFKVSVPCDWTPTGRGSRTARPPPSWLENMLVTQLWNALPLGADSASLDFCGHSDWERNRVITGSRSWGSKVTD